MSGLKVVKCWLKVHQLDLERFHKSLNYLTTAYLFKNGQFALFRDAHARGLLGSIFSTPF